MNMTPNLPVRPRRAWSWSLALLGASLPACAAAQGTPPPVDPATQRIHADVSGTDRSNAGKSANQSGGATHAAPAPPQPAASKRIHADLSGFDLSNAGKSANQTGLASRGNESPLPLAPQSGKAFSTRPEFYWQMAGPRRKMLFKLSDMDGNALWEAETADDRLQYPVDAPALIPGNSYAWTIAPDNEMLGGPAPPAIFVVVGGAERDRIEAELKAAPDEAAQAQVFVDHRIWYDTIERYSVLLARKPDDEKARTMRAEVYDQLPATKNLAEADWRMVH